MEFPLKFSLTQILQTIGSIICVIPSLIFGYFKNYFKGDISDFKKGLKNHGIPRIRLAAFLSKVEFFS